VPILDDDDALIIKPAGAVEMIDAWCIIAADLTSR
jgi:hypothetical protein